MKSTSFPLDLLKRIRRIEIETTKLVEELLAGAWASVFKGRGLEFEDVRRYEPGDDIRTIDWNVTARMDEPYTRRFREERELTVVLLVDISHSLSFGSIRQKKQELAAEIAAALAFSAIRNQDRVSLILFSDKIEHYVPPRKGKRHVLRIIRDIMLFEPEHKKTSIREALKFLGNVAKRSVIAFLFSDFYSEEDIESPVNTLANRHDLILVKVRDPFEEKLGGFPLLQIKDLETGEEALYDTESASSRRRFLKEKERQDDALQQVAKKAGVDLLQFSTGESYTKNIHNFFRTRKERH